MLVCRRRVQSHPLPGGRDWDASFELLESSTLTAPAPALARRSAAPENAPNNEGTSARTTAWCDAYLPADVCPSPLSLLHFCPRPSTEIEMQFAGGCSDSVR